MTRYLADLPSPAITSTLTSDSVLVMPVGAIEQHGPHLPLRTDALVAEAVATAAVDRCAADGLDTWLLPSLSVTKSDEHSWAPGTLALSAATLMATLVDIGAGLAATPARRVVFLNGHGGNSALLQVANRELRTRFGLATFTMPSGLARAGSGAGGESDELGLGIHAGFAETSIVMHLAPELVDLDAFTPEGSEHLPAHIAALEHIGFNNRPVSFGWLSDDFGPTGVIGDPRGANAEAGRQLMAEATSFAVAALGEISRFMHQLPAGST